MTNPTQLAQMFADAVVAGDWAGADAHGSAELRARLGPLGLERAWGEVASVLVADVPGWRPTRARVSPMPQAPDPRFVKTSAPPGAWRGHFYLAFESQEGELACGHVLVVDDGGRLAVGHADFEVFC